MSKTKKIVFRRRVPIRTWDLRLSLQKYQEHPVWLAILMLANENSGRTSAKMIHEKLLVDRMPPLQARLLLNRVVKEGLLNEEYRLTPEGKDALEKKLMPVRMSGSFTISFVDDLLIPQIVLSVSEPHEPRLDSRSLKPDGPARREIEKAEGVPDYIKKVVDKSILVNKESQPIIIREVEEYGLPQNFVLADLMLEFMPNNQTSLRLGNPIDRRFPVPENLDMAYTDALDILLSGFGEDWNRDEEIVLAKFEETDTTERRDFQKSFPISKPTIAGFGVFESVTTPPVRIEPKIQADAQAWFDWLIIDQLPNKYLQRSMFHEHVSKTRVKIPDRFEIEEPNQESLAQDLFRSGDTMRAWLLQAPLDLLPGDAK